MGFLDHSTNNVLIDAVLTDYGRKLLSENQGAFQIASFSLSDDEVDYGIIRKYGRTVGKEKIAKNTPIFEAQTSHKNAMKYRLLTLSDPNVVRMPGMTFTVTNGDGQVNGAGLGAESVQLPSDAVTTLTFKQQMVSGQSVPTGLSDKSYTVMVNDRFLSLAGSTVKLPPDASSQIAAYHIMASGADSSTNASSVNISLKRKSLDASMFTQYGDYNNKDRITSILTVIGNQSGLRKDIKVTIKQVVA